MIWRGLVAAAVGAAMMAQAVSTIPAPQPPAVGLSATALIMSGTGNSLSHPENTTEFIRTHVAETDRAFVAPSGMCVGGDPGCELVAVYTPEQLKFFTGLHDMTLDESVAVGKANLDNCIRGVACTVTTDPYTVTNQQELTDSVDVAFGLSQSAVIASLEKADLIAHPPAKTVSFILVGNPSRPNGGILERFVGVYVPLVGMTFSGATPTNSPEPTPLLTEDYARQYDGWADFPTNPLNVVSLANALAGALFYHAHYHGIDAPQLFQGTYQDTTYYLEPAPLVPLLFPLSRLPLIGMPLALVLDAPLRVLVETGYDRTINPGRPTPRQWLYLPNPIKVAVNLVRSVPTGWDDAIAYASGNPDRRPFHTTPPPVYGVGGPPVNAGSVDPYGPAPRSVELVAAQPDPKPGATAKAAVRPTPPTARRTDPARVARVRAAARTGPRSLGEDRHRAGPSRRRRVNLDREAGHFETTGRQRLQVVQFLDVAVADGAPGAMALPDDRRIVVAGVAGSGVGERRIPTPGVRAGQSHPALQ